MMTDASIKKYALIGLGVASLGIAGFFGLQALYLSATVGALGAYAIFPEKVGKFVTDNRPTLIGGAIGFLWAGPLGMLALGWLGNIAAQTYQHATQKADELLNAVNYAAEPVRIFESAPRSLWNSFKEALNLTAGSDAADAALEQRANVLRFQAPTNTSERPAVVENEEHAPTERRRFTG